MAFNTVTGSRARLKIDGNIVGFAGGVSGGESISYEPVEVLDLLEVREYVPVAYTCSLSAQIFRVVGKSLKALGIFPTEENILTSGDLTLTIEDRLTGETMSQFESVKCAEHNFDITARGVVADQCTFVAIRLRDEFERPLGG